MRIPAFAAPAALAALALAIVAPPAYCASNRSAGFDKQVNSIIHEQYRQYAHAEYFSGIGVAISLPKHPVTTYAVGTVSHRPGSQPMDADSLYQIGSISKSFTSVLVLKLEEAGKLSLNDPLGKYVTQYPKWGHVTIEQALNMTNGLPNYSDSPAWNYLESKDLQRHWSNEELLNFVYPKGKLDPPLKGGYFYTNTGYILTDLVLNRLTKKTYSELLREWLFKPLGLNHSYYPSPAPGSKAYQHLVHGYGYNQYENPELLGRDMRDNDLSWGGAAGGIVATTTDVAHWVRDLFTDPHLLGKDSRQSLTRLVSIPSGKPIEHTSPENPKGFALGVAENYAPGVGTFWFYEGQTLGFRTLYMYVPCNGVIIVAAFNSATNGENDHAHLLLVNLYKEALKTHPALQCES